MLITIKVLGRVFEVWVGYKTQWFEQSHLISFLQLYEDGNEKVQNARTLVQLFPSRRHREYIRYERG